MLIKCADEAKEMLANFRENGISHEAGNGLDKVLRFQDLVGRSNPDGIFEFYDGLDKPTRLTFLWASCACLGPEIAESVVRYTTVKLLRRQEMENLEKEYEALLGQENTFRQAKKTVYKRLRDKDNRIRDLERRNAWLQSCLNDRTSASQRAHAEARENREDAEKYRKIKDLLT